jgi:hypothetical protein
LIYAGHLPELQKIVEENGGGSFAVSIFLRSDGFLIQPNYLFFERLARAGKLSRFCELLKENFEEAVKDAEEKANRNIATRECTGERCEDSLSCLPVGD